MKRYALATVLVVSLSACANPGPLNLATSDSAEVMAAALVELVTEDNTFGGGPPPFTLYLIEDRTNPAAGDALVDESRGSRKLTGTERQVIEGAIEVYGPVQWISDPSDWYTDELAPTEVGSVILGVGEATFSGDTALVPVSLWCGSLCGTWFTYKLERIDAVWQVTGIEGPVAIS